MKKISIVKHYQEILAEKVEKLEFEDDKEGARPSWILIKDESFKSRFISVKTEKEPEILYKRFTGNFYYPVEIKINPKEEKRFYQKFASYYDKFTKKNNLPMAKFILEKIKKLKISKDADILNLGAGTGIFSELAFENGYKNLTLIDNSKPMLDEAKKKKNLKKVRFILADAKNFLLNEKFDAVTSIMMFDAINDKDLGIVLENLKKHLKENGFVFIVEDRERKQYEKYFKEIEKGIFYINKEKGFGKYYWIGRNNQ